MSEIKPEVGNKVWLNSGSPELWLMGVTNGNGHVAWWGNDDTIHVAVMPLQCFTTKPTSLEPEPSPVKPQMTDIGKVRFYVVFKLYMPHLLAGSSAVEALVNVLSVIDTGNEKYAAQQKLAAAGPVQWRDKSKRRKIYDDYH